MDGNNVATIDHQPDAAALPVASEASSTALMRIIEKAALDPSFDITRLEHLLSVKERWEANEARKAFVAAKAAFKAEAPTIGKNKKVGYGSGDKKVGYSHATLDNIADRLSPILGKHGLAYSWSTKQSEAHIEVTCTLTHALGHSESVILRAHADTSGSKNAIQAVGSTISYLERYTLLAITGTATADQDDDGDGATLMIDEAQKNELIALLKESGTDTGKFLDHLGLDALDNLPATRFQPAKKSLQERLKVKAEARKRKAAEGDKKPAGDDTFPGDRP